MQAESSIKGFLYGGYFLFMHKKNHVYSTGCNNQMYFLLVYLSAYEFVSFQKQSIDE